MAYITNRKLEFGIYKKWPAVCADSLISVISYDASTGAFGSKLMIHNIIFQSRRNGLLVGPSVRRSVRRSVLYTFTLRPAYSIVTAEISCYDKATL